MLRKWLLMFVDDLRKMAELNLCKKCYQAYIHLLEPSIAVEIKSLRFSPLSDLRATESNITFMVMKHKGVFKGGNVFIDIPEESYDMVSNEVDIGAYRRIKRRKFKHKIDYLHKQGILGENTHKLLEKIRLIRNPTIHDAYQDFTEQDLALFRWSYHITSQLFLSMRFGSPEELVGNIRVNAEKQSEKLLSWIESIETDRAF